MRYKPETNTTLYINYISVKNKLSANIKADQQKLLRLKFNEKKEGGGGKRGTIQELCNNSNGFNIHVTGDPDGEGRDHAEEKYLNRYWLKSLKMMKDIKPQI